MGDDDAVRLMRVTRGSWALAATTGMPAAAVFLYGLGATRGLLAKLPLLAAFAVPIAVGVALLFIFSTRHRFRPQRLSPAPPDAEFGSGSRPVALVAGGGALLAGLMIFELIHEGTGRSAATVAQVAGGFAGMAVGVAAQALWVRRRERLQLRTYWMETPRLTGWYDRSAVYYRSDAPDLDHKEPELEPLRLSRPRETMEMMARMMAFPGILGLAYGAVAVEGFGESGWSFFGSFGGMFAFIAVYMCIVLSFTIRKTFTKAIQVPAPPDAQLVRPKARTH